MTLKRCYCMFLGVIPCENYSSTLYICSTISVIPISGRYVIFGCSLLLRDKSEKLIGTTFSSGLFGVLKTLSGINQMIYINYQKLWTVRFPAFTFQTKKSIFRTILDWYVEKYNCQISSVFPLMFALLSRLGSNYWKNGNTLFLFSENFYHDHPSLNF